MTMMTLWWHKMMAVLQLTLLKQIHSGDEDRSALLNTPSSVPSLCSSQGLLSLLFIEPMSLTVEEKVENPLPLLSTAQKTEINFIYWTLSHDWLLSLLLMQLTHIHTHTKPLWHLFSSLLLAVHCPCHMASEKAPECVQASNVCVNV